MFTNNTSSYMARWDTGLYCLQWIVLRMSVALAFEGNITMLPLHYEGFVAASVIIIKVGSYDYGIYLINELIHSKG